ncbi:MAG: nitric-oxide reductase large subunit [Vicinamibacteria bacterium]|nr:nitric-oxide reductase large subunit [Vicinamibacteria bacterium]
MKRLWIALAVVMVFSFGVLGWIGSRIYQEMPPVPDRVVTTDGAVVVPEGAILRGQNVWQSMGGMQVGSVWGHGSYLAPDWTADWLHGEATFMLDEWAKADFGGKAYADIPFEDQARLRGRLEKAMRTNTYDPAARTITIDPIRARAFEHSLARFSEVFMKGNPRYAIPPGAVRSEERMRDMAAFFFWTSWSAATSRPGQEISYTNNWPHEPLVGNRPTGDSVMWTGVSILMLLAGICAMVWWRATQPTEPIEEAPEKDPLGGWHSTASQLATLKYFWIVAALILVQIGVGVVTAHYGVEGGGFYGIDLAKILPYAVARTWHVQLGIFWIATAWLAAGLYIGPLVSGKEPKFQRLGVNVLFGALLLIVVGSLAGEWLSIQNKLTDDQSFYFGHQGYEYVELGRVFQAALFAGLLIWLTLVVRSVASALRQDNEQRPLLWLFVLSSGAIGLFYGAGLNWGQHTHLSIVEYWRWWVVHLWVEGFFEVFATTVIAFFFARLQLIQPRLAAKAAILSATIYLAGGIIGTCHHLYFSGTPIVALAWGSVFSALEVVPLVMVAYSAIDDLRRGRSTIWTRQYRWPINYFVATAFWNMVGAGLFGFMINPPIALYFMQGLNTTPVHGHAALFGVYGMLGIGLMLTCLRAMSPASVWNERWMAFAFWAMNLGLAAMCFLSLLPVGLLQTWASVEKGYWFARSTEFLDTPLMQALRWMRAPGDILFALGAAALVAFVLTVRPRRRDAE